MREGGLVLANQYALSVKESAKLNEYGFAENVLKYTPIRESDATLVSVLLQKIIQDNAVKDGIKEKIKQPIEADIIEEICTNYNKLSLEEINYSFKLNRSGRNWKRIEHYQNFNTSYVCDILNEYNSWLQEVRVERNLPIFKPEKEEASLMLPEAPKTQEDVKVETERRINDIISYYKEYGKFSMLQTMSIFDNIFICGFLNAKDYVEGTEKYGEYRLRAGKIAQKKADERDHKPFVQIQNFETRRKEKQKEKDFWIISYMKHLVVEDYIKSLIEKEKEEQTDKE